MSNGGFFHKFWRIFFYLSRCFIFIKYLHNYNKIIAVKYLIFGKPYLSSTVNLNLEKETSKIVYLRFAYSTNITVIKMNPNVCTQRK
jgi:hypothetical protein